MIITGLLLAGLTLNFNARTNNEAVLSLKFLVSPLPRKKKAFTTIVMKAFLRSTALIASC